MLYYGSYATELTKMPHDLLVELSNLDTTPTISATHDEITAMLRTNAICRVVFEKKGDFTIRDLWCTRNSNVIAKFVDDEEKVIKQLDVERLEKDKAYGRITVFDLQKLEFRNFLLPTAALAGQVLLGIEEMDAATIVRTIPEACQESFFFKETRERLYGKLNAEDVEEI